MAYQHRTTTTAAIASAGTSLDIAWVADIAAGDVVALTICFDGSPGTISGLSAFTETDGEIQFKTYFLVPAAGTESGTLSISWENTVRAAAIMHAAHEDGGQVLRFGSHDDQRSGGGTSHSTPSLNTADKSLIVTAFMWSVNNSNNFSATGDLTERGETASSTVRNTIALMTAEQANGGATGAKTASSSVSLGNCSSHIMTFYPEAEGPLVGGKLIRGGLLLRGRLV